jgi:hypothetical protein
MAQSRKHRDSENRLRAQLGAFNEATLTITAELSLDRVLQRIAHLARELARSMPRWGFRIVRADWKGS